MVVLGGGGAVSYERGTPARIGSEKSSNFGENRLIWGLGLRV
jgi:hypothetical protein